MNIVIAAILALTGTLGMIYYPGLLGYICGGIMWFCAGGLNTWDLIRRYRKSLGYKEDPFEPENIYMI